MHLCEGICVEVVRLCTCIEVGHLCVCICVEVVHLCVVLVLILCIFVCVWLFV